MCSLKFIVSLWELLRSTILFLCGSAFKICLDIYQLLMTYFDVFKDHLPKILQNNPATTVLRRNGFSHAGSRFHS